MEHFFQNNVYEERNVFVSVGWNVIMVTYLKRKFIRPPGFSTLNYA